MIFVDRLAAKALNVSFSTAKTSMGFIPSNFTEESTAFGDCSNEALRRDTKSDLEVAILDDALDEEKDNFLRLIFNVIATAGNK